MINQERQKLICRSCTNCRINLAHGIICNLTKKKADFGEECSNFEDKFQLKPRVSSENHIRA